MICCPLSPLQKSIYQIDRYLANNLDIHIYNVPFVVDLFGDLHIDTLEMAMNFIIKKHATLRTFIKTKNGCPTQNIVNNLDNKLIQKDISGFNNTEKSKLKQKMISQAINYRFVLESNNSSLLKSFIFNLGKGHYTLIFVAHHIIMDEWSIGLLLRELALFYNILIKENNFRIENLPMQFWEFCVLQRENSNSNHFNKKIEYWNTKLSEIPNYDNKFTFRNTLLVSNSGFYQFKLNEKISKELRIFCIKNKVTMFTILISIYSLLLYMLIEKNLIYISYPVANRTCENVANIIGCFVNSIILKVKIHESSSFSNLLTNIKLDILESFDNQDVPVLLDADILRQLHNFTFEIKKRDNYQINLINTQSKYYTASDFQIDDLLNIQNSTNEEINLELEYQMDICSKSYAINFANHFCHILNKVLQNPYLAVEQILSCLKSIKTPSKSLYQKKTPQTKFNNTLLGNFNENVNQKIRVANRLNNMMKLSVKV